MDTEAASPLVQNSIEWPSDPSKYEWKGTLTQDSSVWQVLAHCKQHKTDVIIEIKQYQIDNSAQEDTLESIEDFQQRLKTLIHINHENLITPIHSFSFKNEVWTIYPRYSGSVLSDLLTSHYPNGIHDESLIAYLLFNIIKGLNYLHNVNQICHRNIRPSSIYFDKELAITLLCEFQQLKTIKFTKKYHHTESIVSASREPWTDPLLLVKHPNANWYDGDIYSLGITALHLVYGSPPNMTENITKYLIKLSPNNNDNDELYSHIGINCYTDMECPIKSKVFEQFINDCTSAPSKRIKISKLLQHSFFYKKNIYTAEEVQSKISQLFPSIESKINSAFTAPISFPNVVQSQNLTDIVQQKLMLQVEHADISETEQKETQIVTEESNDKNINLQISDDTDWNFRTTMTPRITDEIEQIVQSTEAKVVPLITEDLETFDTGNAEISPQGYNNHKMGRFQVEQLKRASSENSVYLEPDEWTATDCGDWVVTLGEAYIKYRKIFIDNGIDGEMLQQIDDDLLKEIVTSKLHRAKILTACDKLFKR